MPPRRVLQHASGETVRRRLREVRESQGLTLARVQQRLRDLGREYMTSTLSQIENGGRRVDVDDLVALAAALGVAPVTLLMPTTHEADEFVTTTASVDPVPAYRLWWWLRTEHPLVDNSPMANVEFQYRSKPPWHEAEFRNVDTIPPHRPHPLRNRDEARRINREEIERTRQRLLE